MSAAKVELGRRLFYDTRLSGNGTYACATCHDQRFAFTDGKPHAIGSTGAEHPRSAMGLTNVAYNVAFGWADPTLSTPEAQASVPMLNEHPIELGLKGKEAEVVARFNTPDDLAFFAASFPGTGAAAGSAAAVSLDHIAKAIASFERTLISGDSPFDRYLYRDQRDAISAEARRGMDLFFSKRLRCSECHSGFNLSGPVQAEGVESGVAQFHNTGLYNVDGHGAYPASDHGLFDKTHVAKDMGRFRAPTLRNIAVTAPYMHDGSLPSLEAVIAHYAKGGLHSAITSDRINGFRISDAETRDLIEFLRSLTDQAFLSNPAFGRPAIR